MTTINFKVRLKSCKNRGASVGGLYTLTGVTRENCQILLWKCQQEFLERLQMYRCVTNFDVLLTVHLSIILVINQLNAQIPFL